MSVNVTKPSADLEIPSLLMALGLERVTGSIKRVDRYRWAIQIAIGSSLS